MSLPMSEARRRLNNLRADLWRCNGSETDIDGVLSDASLLKAQLEFQKVLLAAANSLRQHADDAALPHRQATRVKNLVKYIFEHGDYGTEKQTQLRALSPPLVIFLGLCFKVKKIQEMSALQFDFLVANLPDFMQRQKIFDYLYRDDINKAVYSDIEPEDVNQYLVFLKSTLSNQDMSDCRANFTEYIELRAAQGLKRKFNQVDQVASGHTNDVEDPGQLGIGSAPPNNQNHKKTYSRTNESLGSSGRQIQYMFSKAPIDLIPYLGDRLSRAIQTSNQWEMERNLGEPTTECFAALIPEGGNKDISLTVWAGREEGYRVIEEFKMHRTWSALPIHQSLQPHAQPEQCSSPSV